MRITILLLLSSLVVAAAWLVQPPRAAHADEEVPEKYRGTVARALEFLASRQHKDGHWESDDGKHPVAMTALVGMAFLMEGSHADAGKYSANIRNAVEWLMAKSDAKRGGLIYSDHPSETDRYMYGHGLATQFLAWAYGSENHLGGPVRFIVPGQRDTPRQEKFKGILARAVKYIRMAQSTRGGWYRTSKVEGHDLDELTSTAIQIQALYIAGFFEIGVPGPAEADAQEYLKTALEKYEKEAQPGQSPSRVVDTVTALVCRSCPDATQLGNYDLCKKWFKFCKAEIPVGAASKLGRDELTHYYYARAVYNDLLRTPRNMIAQGPIGDTSWPTYRTAMFDHLQASQNKDGSWPAGDGICVGTVYATALWCTILQLDTNRHPLTREINVNSA